jgi:hypothetical protein
MYARLLFVVVGILGPVLARFQPFGSALSELRLGIPGACSYTLAA